jgi:hypothetical protein
MHSLPEKYDPSDSTKTLEMVLLGVFLFLLGPVVVLASAYLFVFFKEDSSNRQKFLLFTGALLGLLWLWFVGPHYAELYYHKLLQNPFGVILRSWLLSLPLIPLGVVGMGCLDWLLNFLRPSPTLEGWEQQEARAIEQRHGRFSDQALSQLGNVPQVSSDLLLLGPRIGYASFPDHIGFRQVGSWIALEERILDQHLFILGAPGSGKSTTLMRLAWEVLEKTDRDLFIVDGKGEEEFASKLRSLIWTTRSLNAPVFRLGHGEPGATYNGFQGDSEAIYNRLAAMIGVRRAEGGAEYYADRNRDFLQLICFAPGGPPRSFDEVRDRLRPAWLKNAWKDDPREFEDVASFTKEDYSSIQARIRPLARVFSETVSPEGFSLESSRAAIFSLRAMSAPDTAGRLLEFFIEDLKDFAGKRQERPALLIIDEFGVLGNDNIIDLLRLARAAKLGIVLATQDIAGLGDEQTRESLLSSTVTKMLMATDYPEALAKLAGTKKRIEASMQHEEGKATGTGSARLQDVFGIDMNEASRLRVGETFLFRQRYPVKLRVSPTDEEMIQEAPPEEYERRDYVSPPGAQGEPEEDEQPGEDDDTSIDFKDFL